MTRRESRQAALFALYEREVNHNEPDEIYSCAEQSGTYEVDEHTMRTVRAVLDHISEIDALIEPRLLNRVLSRVPPLPLSIMRLSCAEMLYMDDIPNNISISEAVVLARRYCSTESYSFINGILGSICAELEGHPARPIVGKDALRQAEDRPASDDEAARADADKTAFSQAGESDGAPIAGEAADAGCPAGNDLSSPCAEAGTGSSSAPSRQEAADPDEGASSAAASENVCACRPAAAASAPAVQAPSAAVPDTAADTVSVAAGEEK